AVAAQPSRHLPGLHLAEQHHTRLLAGAESLDAAGDEREPVGVETLGAGEQARVMLFREMEAG
ncbi:MAG TPA: hypothetical protein VG709_01325, partial [Actinomycetota bacterium]|nr:hypothetical protein [Actinomycetota bacterium]